MSKGFLVLAQNNTNVDYVRQAYALALSIKNTQKIVKDISLITNDEVPAEYHHAFDKIIPIPFTDQAKVSEWKVENRWKVYHASPYDETIVLDADMLVLKDLKHCWNFVKTRNLFFTSQVFNYKEQLVIDTHYRKMFVENDLPNLYAGMFYFKKSTESLQFFKLLEYISYNWERFFFEIAPNHNQNFFSMDVASAIAAKLLGIDDHIVLKNSPFTFVHMKPALQGWVVTPSSCYTQVMTTVNPKKELTIGGFKQKNVFHYVEPDFLTDDMLEKLRV